MQTMAWSFLVADRLPICIESEIVLPLLHEEPRTFTVADPFFAGHDLVDELLYMMQRAPHHLFRVYVEKGGRAADYARSSETRLSLIRRLRHMQIVVRDAAQLPDLVNFPVKAVAFRENVSLGRWLPHDFSMDARSGACEECGRGKLQSKLHSDGAALLAVLIAECEPSEYMVAQAARAGIEVAHAAA